MPSLDFSHGTYLIPQGVLSTLATDAATAIYFDCVVSETVIRDAEVTEFPVEVGANISDHYRVKLTGVKLDVFVSQEPINDFTHPEGQPFYGAQALDFGAHPYPQRQLDLATVATAVVNPVGLITNAISGALGGDPRPFSVGQVLQFALQFDSLQALLSSLDALRKKATLVDIYTKSQAYIGFAIGQVTTSRDRGTGSGTKVSIEFRQIATVQTQQTGAPPIPAFPKDTPPVEKGAQQGVDPGQKQSGLSAVVGYIAPKLGIGVP